MTRLALIIIVLFSVIGSGFCQSVNSDRQGNFSELYKKAVNALSTNLEGADVYTIDAIRVASDQELWKAYFLQGLICKKRNEYKRSIVFYKKALGFAQDDLQRVYTNNNIANSYFELGELKKAMSYCVAILKRAKKVGYDRGYNALGIMAKVYAKKQQIDSARYYFARAIALIPDAHDQDGQVTAGFVAAKAQMYSDIAQYDKAVMLFQQAVNIQKTSYDRCEAYLGIAKCFLMQKKYSKTQEYLNKAYKLQGERLYCQVQVLRLRLTLERERGHLKGVEAICKTLASLASNNAIARDKVLYSGIQRQIQRELLYVAEVRGYKIERILFSVIMILPLSLLVYLLFRFKRKNRFKSYQDSKVSQMVVIKSLTDEATLKNIDNQLNELRSNGLLGGGNIT